MAEVPKTEARSPAAQADPAENRLLTREELAVVLKVSLSTVDRMLADGEIPHIRLRGSLVRFYLPDVVRQLVATALTRKRGPGKGACPLAPEVRSPKSEVRGRTVTGGAR